MERRATDEGGYEPYLGQIYRILAGKRLDLSCRLRQRAGFFTPLLNMAAGKRSGWGGFND
ncbi:MAG: hypothetical protein HFH01_12985 [Dorea sp.]|nr:hypothetical protein [Dorea sp.]